MKTIKYQISTSFRIPKVDVIGIDMYKNKKVSDLLKIISSIKSINREELKTTNLAEDELLENVDENFVINIKKIESLSIPDSNQNNNKSSNSSTRKQHEKRTDLQINSTSTEKDINSTKRRKVRPKYEIINEDDDNYQIKKGKNDPIRIRGTDSKYKPKPHTKSLYDNSEIDKYDINFSPKVKKNKAKRDNFDDESNNDGKSIRANQNIETIAKCKNVNKRRSSSAYKPKINYINDNNNSPSRRPPPKHSQPKLKVKSPKIEKIKYLYQTNIDTDAHEIELDTSATVLTMKQTLAQLYDVSNVKNVKIIFSGKDLLDDIILKSLNIGDIILFVYFRSEEDIYLLTAKALRYDKENSEYSDPDL